MSRRGEAVKELFAEIGERLAAILDEGVEPPSARVETALEPRVETNIAKRPVKRAKFIRPPKITRPIDDLARAKARKMLRASGIYLPDDT